MSKTKNIIIIILLCIIFFLIGILSKGYFDKKGNVKDTSNDFIEEQNTTNTSEENDISLDNLVGDWGTCDGEYSCKGIIVSKVDATYYYTPYIMWSEYGGRGEIKKITKTKENQYEMEVYYEGYENEMSSAPEETLNYKLDISDISNNIIYINEEKYQKIVGEREAFYTSIMK